MIRPKPRFAELAATTNFSFLRGASHPEEMVARAAELGLAGLGDRRPQHARRRRARACVCAREQGGDRGNARRPRRAARPSSTARPTCSPIRRIAPPMAGSAGCSRRETCARPRANAGSISTICWSAARACRSSFCRRRLSSPRGRDREGERAARRKGASRDSEAGATAGSQPPRLAIEQRSESKVFRFSRDSAPALDRASLTYGEDMRGALAKTRGARAQGRRAAPCRQRRADACRPSGARSPMSSPASARTSTLEAAGRLTQANAERHLKSAREMARLFAEAPEAVEETIALSRRPDVQPRRARAPLSRGTARRFRHAARGAGGLRARRARERAIPTGVPETVRGGARA